MIRGGHQEVRNSTRRIRVNSRGYRDNIIDTYGQRIGTNRRISKPSLRAIYTLWSARTFYRRLENSNVRSFFSSGRLFDERFLPGHIFRRVHRRADTDYYGFRGVQGMRKNRRGLPRRLHRQYPGQVKAVAPFRFAFRSGPPENHKGETALYPKTRRRFQNVVRRFSLSTSESRGRNVYGHVRNCTRSRNGFFMRYDFCACFG